MCNNPVNVVVHVRIGMKCNMNYEQYNMTTNVINSNLYTKLTLVKLTRVGRGQAVIGTCKIICEG